MKHHGFLGNKQLIGIKRQSPRKNYKEVTTSRNIMSAMGVKNNR